MGRSSAQEADQRLRLALPACTIDTIELTIIERASLVGVRPSSSEASTRSGPDVFVAEGCPALAGMALG